MTDLAETTNQQQRGKPFEKGQSGNPSGRPLGARHKTTLAVQALLDGEAETLTRKAVELALAGDITALRLCLERIAPAYKATTMPVTIDVPPHDNLADTARAFIAAAARGELAPDIAAQLVAAVASVARVEEIETVKQRVEAIERAIKEQKPCK